MSKKARDLLPPDGPAPVRAEDVRPSDDDLEYEVETRKIGIRRVSSLDFADKLTARTRWRPAGNSRRFWRQIEADDPFKKRPARPTDAPLEMYPAQRIERVEGSMPKPQPEVARSTNLPPRREAEPPRPQPRREQPRREQPRPERAEAPAPVHTPDPRPAAPPPSRQPEEPVAPPAPAEPTQQNRRLPPKPPNDRRSRTGRQRMPSRAQQQQAVYGSGGKTAAEIRAAKQRAREAGSSEEEEHPIKKRSLDAIRETMKNLMYHQQQLEAGVENLPEVPHIDELDGGGGRRVKGEKKRAPRKPRAAAPAPSRPAPPPEPAPPPAPVRPPPVDRTPPRPAAAEPEGPDRSPSAARGGNNAGLDDLFGGGGDRPRIGRRTKKSEPGAEE